MIDKNKVLKGLEICSAGECGECPYNSGYSTGCFPELTRDALSVLTPRVLTLKEVLAGHGRPVFLEGRGHVYGFALSDTRYSANGGAVIFAALRAYRPDDPEGPFFLKKPHYPSKYMRTWRCWSGEPTEEQRKEAPWDAR